MKTIKILLILCIVFHLKLTHLNAQTTTDAAATGISRAFNPAISVNGLFGAMGSNKSSPVWEESGLAPGMHLQAADVEITSNVDVYMQSKFVFGADEEEGLGIEEAYLTSLRMPIPITVRGGLMLNTFGRYNLYHIHHMVFAENPLILNYIFQSKLNEVGIEASYLVPLPWYSDLLAGFLNGSNDKLFNSGKQEDFAYLGHFENFWDITDETTFRLGTSYLTGAKGLRYATETPFDSTINTITSMVWGIDFQLKWKPLRRGRYHSFILEGEYVNAALAVDHNFTRPLHGYYVQGLYQFGLKWWIQSRLEWFKRSKDLYNYFPAPAGIMMRNQEDFSGKRISLALAYVPTEFSAFRLQYNFSQFEEADEQQIIVQVNVTIGSHPAHKY